MSLRFLLSLLLDLGLNEFSSNEIIVLLGLSSKEKVSLLLISLGGPHFMILDRLRVMNHPLIMCLEVIPLNAWRCLSVVDLLEELGSSVEDLFVDFRVSLDLFLTPEVNPLKIGVLYFLPIDISEVQVPMQFLSILASLHLASLLDGGVLQLLESALWEVRHLYYLSPAQPFLPVDTTFAGEESEKAHFLLKPLIVIELLCVGILLRIELLLRVTLWELYLHHPRYLVRLY